MNELIQQFITDEVTALTYSDLWNFINSNSICRGTFEGNNHIIMKISSNQFIIYRICLGMENTKYQEAVLVAKTYLLKDKQHGLPASFRGYSEHFRLIAF